MAKNKKVYDVCANRIKEKLGKTIPEVHKEVQLEADLLKQRQQVTGEGAHPPHKVIKLREGDNERIIGGDNTT